MAAVDETVTGNTASSIFTPGGGMCDVVNEAESDGEIMLQEKTTSGSWIDVTDKKGAYTVNTPDYSGGITYRFLPKGLTSAVRVYMNNS